MGNHNYCRNPDSSMGKPWCYAVDTKEKKECEVPKCKESAINPEQWVAPVGSKSKDAPAEPCEPKPVEYIDFKAFSTSWMGKVRESKGLACSAGSGDKQYLMGLKLKDTTDKETCAAECRMMPGAKYMTYFAKKMVTTKATLSSVDSDEVPEGTAMQTLYAKPSDDSDDKGGNCACLRTACVPVPEDLTIGDPATYELGSFKVVEA